MIAIDLGSNTLRVVQMDCESMKIINEYEKIVKTADGLLQYGVINKEAIARVISAIQEAGQQIDFTSCSVKAVTTEAVRRATNSDAVLLQIEKETGIAFEIISGDEEARLTLSAVKHRLAKLHFASNSFVVVDIGGGSTELIFSYPDKVISKSFPLGIMTISQTYESLESIKKSLPGEMFEMQMFCAEVYANHGEVNSFVATAGTPTTVAAMKLEQTYACYNAKRINGTTIVKNELDFYLEKLLAMSFKRREIAVGVGRSELIAAGILIFKQLYSIVEFDSCVVIDDGLREGVALEECLSLH